MAYFFGLLAVLGWIWAAIALAGLAWVVWRRPDLQETARQTGDGDAHR